MWARLAVVAVIVAALSGCYRHTYTVAGTTPEQEPSYSEWRSHLFLGLIALNGPVDLRGACPQGIARVEDAVNFWNFLVTLFTATIYAPSTIDVFCQAAAPPPAVAPLPPESPPTDPTEIPLDEGPAEPIGAPTE